MRRPSGCGLQKPLLVTLYHLMGSSQGLPHSPDMSVAHYSHFHVPPTGWPSTDQINEHTEFPVYLAEVNANGTYPCHHELLVDFSQVYGFPPLNLTARGEGPDANRIPFCGSAFHLGVNKDRSTYLKVQFSCEGFLLPCTFYHVNTTHPPVFLQRVQQLGSIRDVGRFGCQMRSDGQQVFDLRCWFKQLWRSAEDLFHQKVMGKCPRHFSIDMRLIWSQEEVGT